MSTTIRARVSRTIQEKQYHPFNVELSAEYESQGLTGSLLCAEAAKKLADALTEQVDALISERQAQLANRR